MKFTPIFSTGNQIVIGANSSFRTANKHFHCSMASHRQ